MIDLVEEHFRKEPKTWLLTGVSGFIGTNILKRLLTLGQKVVGLDNFSTGVKENLQQVQKLVGEEAWSLFTMIEGDIRDFSTCKRAMEGVDIVLHQAALGSVPRSFANPGLTNEVNVGGTVNIFQAAKEMGIKKVVYASSSSVYGDSQELPKVEENLGNALSPYAVSKLTDELYASVFSNSTDMDLIGLRYFNVFGPYQSPEGPYAAVLPLWVKGMIKNQPITIFGDGETSRDFTFVENVVDINLLAAHAEKGKAKLRAYNCACSAAYTLNELHDTMQEKLAEDYPHVTKLEKKYGDFREGDVRHSHADISNASEDLGYKPRYVLAEGIDMALEWYKNNLL
ncbi:MAG: NAD-dependent epimerase/dehydratase family protein [Halobacteriovoraceae bacterium]|nr:NAD-dependent epimerase/dehydratase family protein [Halobacteriovoraceae bacterium]MBT5092793.1 NAD-dependent epimerase/dehydratase family protein [Halobacteriovoraceae bacterium]